MSPLAVFVRTLLKSSAIFIGATAIFLHPQLEWRTADDSRRVVGAAPGRPGEGGGRRPDRGVEGHRRRRPPPGRSARSRDEQPRAVPALVAAMKDADADTRAIVVSALGELGDVRAVSGAARRAQGRERHDPRFAPRPRSARSATAAPSTR